MKNICLVEGGKFVLGIDTRDIIARTTYGQAAQDSTSDRMFHLGALLARQPCSTLESNSACLRLKTKTGFLFLLVDRVVQEIELIDSPVPLPSFCPSLARQLCPLAAIHENSAVPLLDSTQIEAVCDLLGNGIGWTAVKTLLTSKKLPEQIETVQKETAAEPEVDVQDQSVEKKAAASIDEEMFKEIMSWTISRFKQSKDGNTLNLDTDQLPSDLAEMAQRKGLSANVIQYLIKQIVSRCQESINREPAGEKDVG